MSREAIMSSGSAPVGAAPVGAAKTLADGRRRPTRAERSKSKSVHHFYGIAPVKVARVSPYEWHSNEWALSRDFDHFRAPWHAKSDSGLAADTRGSAAACLIGAVALSVSRGFAGTAPRL